VGRGWWGKLKLKLTQPQVELEAWDEPGKNKIKKTRPAKLTVMFVAIYKIKTVSRNKQTNIKLI
jgi:hypothetical protein